MQASRRFLAIVILFVAISGGAEFIYYAFFDQRARPEHAMVLPAPMALPAFSLLDRNGDPFTRDSLRGGWHLLFFGFTHCPDICPVTLQQLALAKKRLAEEGGAFPGIVFVSVDPERDSPDTLAAYVDSFSAGIEGVSGDLEQLHKLSKPLGIYFARSGDLDGDYSVDHSAVVLLINPAAEWQALFSTPHSVDNFVHDMPLLTSDR